ncbi:DUF1475 domain-containing protein [candidate division KSB1 bacterium]|nr:DUF1475 domain-containing protein [candidate division KSB1 bacterium]NIS28038.1 DUF1475 domain-containing protein [candidate division KSB1 bacterium]NIT74909.1 DUF1475 domain-containing protein [candidate division KSB1 bacterium]NIU28693.1 DUF1475 domain-containing protein [candidate division KSB1 bacterium]NIU93286.1 DUF1475 domain-containing protein [candidate division KSB1 bacterium]
MRNVLVVLFLGILTAMLYVTTTASLDRGVFVAGSQLWPDPWFRATLADAYFGFITFYVWVVYKERSLAPRIIWFVLIMAFGNIAMSIYVLAKLFKLEPSESVEALLLRRST